MELDQWRLLPSHLAHLRVLSFLALWQTLPLLHQRRRLVLRMVAAGVAVVWGCCLLSGPLLPPILLDPFWLGQASGGGPAHCCGNWQGTG